MCKEEELGGASVQAEFSTNTVTRIQADIDAAVGANPSVGTETEPADTLPLDSLRVGATPREQLDEEHVALLAEQDGPFAPLVVHRRTHQVIDGIHRFHAARSRGDRSIAVRYFEGSSEDAFVRAVQANVAHGLPLSLRERRSAAMRILISHPHWSDRRTASVVGLAARTVSELRAVGGLAGQSDVKRVGRDGRGRPTHAREGRERAAELLRSQPQASLRCVAEQAGVSPGTVRDVRVRLERGEDPVARRGQNRGPSATAASAQEKRPAPVPVQPQHAFERSLRALRQDPSLRFTEVGRFLLRALEPRAHFATRQEDLLQAVPVHCAPFLSTAARAYADSLMSFAAYLESMQHEPEMR